MMRRSFNEVVLKVPHLTADGIILPDEPLFEQKRQDFVNNAVYLQQTNDAYSLLSSIGKSARFSQWQRKHCTPEELRALFEWYAGRPVSPGAIIVAALHLGFTMGIQDGKKVYFNFLARQIESEMAQFSQMQAIRKVVGA